MTPCTTQVISLLTLNFQWVFNLSCLAEGRNSVSTADSPVLGLAPDAEPTFYKICQPMMNSVKLHIVTQM